VNICSDALSYYSKKLFMNSRLILLLFIYLSGCSTAHKNVSDAHSKVFEKKISGVLSQSVGQYKILMKNAPAGSLPRTFENGEVKTTASDGWVSGFFPGTLLYLYQHTKDETLLNEALLRMKLLEKEQFNKNTHDLGFMMYCSFGNANRLAPDARYDSILIHSARSLSSRYNPAVGCIRSWNSQASHFVVIIDNMMNLEILMYAFRQTNDSSFYHIAVTHANTTMKNHFRSDYSSYHVVDYNPNTGAVQEKRTHQGAANESAWARGQAWGLYGYTMMYRETGDKKYLNQAKHIADFILHHPNLPADKIPYWDFDAPGIPNTYRDVSAAAIISSALLELATYTSGAAKKEYQDVAAIILKNLSNPPYKSEGNEVGGFLLKHSVGHLPGKSEIDVPLSYADYYFVEAMMRYLGELKIEKTSVHKSK
jgi:rhamnogalacturonyl hydrolase YesR